MAERKVFTTLVFVRIFYLISRDLQEFIGGLLLLLLLVLLRSGDWGVVIG